MHAADAQTLSAMPPLFRQMAWRLHDVNNALPVAKRYCHAMISRAAYRRRAASPLSPHAASAECRRKIAAILLPPQSNISPSSRHGGASPS
jgi:hypothetical protein